MSTDQEAVPARSSKEQFDRQASHYNAQWNAWSQETISWMLENSGHEPDNSVLDVATGTGFTALAFAPFVKSVIGLDVSPGMLAEARRQAAGHSLHNVSFQEGAAEALPFADEAFDIVTCRIAPHHFLDIRKFVSEARRVLKPDGRLILVDTTVPDGSPEAAAWQNKIEALRDPSHVRNYTPEEWREIVACAGLVIETVSSDGSGITIPLSDWIVKAGCTPETAEELRRAFADAPEGIKEAYRIQAQPNGEVFFTWRRVALKALKTVNGSF